MPAKWRCGPFDFALDRPLVMGIVNTTPDSFSDGGACFDPRTAVATALEMACDGADIIDVGGESTRPGAAAVDLREELERVLSVVDEIASHGICVSVDTRHAAVARACLDAGAAIINDVTGFRDPAMTALAASCDAGLVAMHMRGEPDTMASLASYDDVVAEVRAELASIADRLVAAGIDAARICLDPGIGFAKDTAHNLEILARLGEFARLGRPLLVGASRKRFIGEVTGETTPRLRLGGSIAVAVESVARGAAVVRVHDVRETVQALAVTAAIEEARPCR